MFASTKWCSPCSVCKRACRVLPSPSSSRKSPHQAWHPHEDVSTQHPAARVLPLHGLSHLRQSHLGWMESASAAWTMLAQRGGLYGGGVLDQSTSPTLSSPSSGASSLIESVLTPSNVAGPVGPRARPHLGTGAVHALGWLRSSRLQATSSSSEPNSVFGTALSSASKAAAARSASLLRDSNADKSFAVYAESQASREAWVNCIRDARAITCRRVER